MNLYFHHQWLMRNPRLRSPLRIGIVADGISPVRSMLDGIGILVQGHVQVGDGQVGFVERAVIIAQHIAEALVGFGQGVACRNEQTGSLPIVRHILPDWRWYSPWMISSSVSTSYSSSMTSCLNISSASSMRSSSISMSACRNLHSRSVLLAMSCATTLASSFCFAASGSVSGKPGRLCFRDVIGE